MLAHLSDHNLELCDVVLSLAVQIMYLCHLLVDLVLADESAQLAIDALNVELAAQVCNLLVPQLDHIDHSLVESLGLRLN